MFLDVQLVRVVLLLDCHFQKSTSGAGIEGEGMMGVVAGLELTLGVINEVFAKTIK